MRKSICNQSARSKAGTIVLASALATSLCACNGAKEESTTAPQKTETTQPKEESKMTLTEALNEQKSKSAKMIPDEKKKIMTSAIDVLRESGIEEGVLKKGAQVPEFELPGADGKKLALKDALANGPVVIVFYRGGWCPYCNLNLHYLQEKLDEIKAQGASLVAISPETPDNSLSTKEKNELKFAVLSDQGNKVADKFGLVFTLPDELNELYKNFGIDLEKSNGDKEHKLPLAATFIVAKDGTVLERFVDVDYKNRMAPEEIVAVLKEHKESQ